MTENISQYVKSIVHDTRNRVNDDMKCVGKGLWHEDCIIHYRKTAETAFLALLHTVWCKKRLTSKTKIFSCGHFYFIGCFSADKIVVAGNSMVTYFR